MKKVLLLYLLAIAGFNAYAQLSVKDPVIENQVNPINITKSAPRFSWILTSPKRNVKQTAYRLLVADDSLLLKKNRGNIWDTKKVTSEQSIQVVFQGPKLLSGKTYYWKILAWDNFQTASSWSKINHWQMGLLNMDDWKGARWIAYARLPDSSAIIPAIESSNDPRWNKGNDILPLMRKEFSISKTVMSATAYITGLGQFEMSINGLKVGDHFLDPGWTNYDKNTLYVAFDITNNLKKGINAVGVMLGNGFYYIPGERYHKLIGAFGYPKMICRIVVRYQDGSEENILSDETWKTAPGPVTFSSIYGGEDYDATKEQIGWNKPLFNDITWQDAITVSGPANLEAQEQYPLKIFDHFSPTHITHPKPGILIYDLGQNASAVPFIKLKGKKGSVVKITPAELLDSEGLATQEAIGAPVYFNYTLKGAGTESWQPQFMYYGFRYLQVEGAVCADEANPLSLPVLINIESLHTRNSAATTGTFSCSDTLFNNIFKLVDWAIKSNTASVFTDCPHREKLGWLEEAYLVGNSIHYNYDIALLCRKVVRDMINAQTAEGLVPDIAPEYVRFAGGFRDSPEWGSNSIILPYYAYQWYNDKQLLEDSYAMMKNYANYLEKKSKNHILYFGLGDWYDIGPKAPGESQLTPKGITATATYYYDLKILTVVAHILGKTSDEKMFAKLCLEVKQTYNQTFFNKNTRHYGSGSQTANAISVFAGLVEPRYKQQVIDNIVSDIKLHHYGLTAGDIGYRYLVRVLDDNNRSDIIFKMNSNANVPGYGYQLLKGATALTESWQANKTASNNHFMLGHLMEWLYSGVGGLKSAEKSTAFKISIIRPQVTAEIKYAKVSYQTPYGAIFNEWHQTKKSFLMNTIVPVNTTAVIYLPAKKDSYITESGKEIASCRDLKVIGFKHNQMIIKIGSGNYHFNVKKGQCVAFHINKKTRLQSKRVLY